MEIDEIVDKAIEYARQFPNASNNLIKQLIQENKGYETKPTNILF